MLASVRCTDAAAVKILADGGSLSGYTRARSSKNFTRMKLISPPSSRELRLLVQCLELYYRQGQSQKDIAKALGVSAATVSRLLKRAMDEGFVRVELDLPRTEQLEAALTQKFGLREAVVIVSGGRGDVKAELGPAAAAA